MRHDALTVSTVGKVLPQLLSDEGHERVQKEEQLLEVVLRSGKRGAVDRLTVVRLHQLKVGAGEVILDHTVEQHHRVADAVLREVVVERLAGVAQHLGKPPHGGSLSSALLRRLALLPALYEAVRIPDLIAEVAPLLTH